MKGYKVTQSADRTKIDKVIPSLEKVRNVDAAIRDYVLYSLGWAYWHRRQCGEARQAFSELAENYPDSRWFPLADAQVRSPEDCPSLEAQEIPVPAEDCGAVGEGRDGKEAADCWFASRQYRKAKEIYRRLSPTVEILTQLSKAAARSQDFETAIRANEDLRRLFPKSREGQEALRRIAFLHQDSGDYASALRVLKDLVARTKARSEKRLYLERMGWCHFRLEQYEAAVDRFDDALALEETPRSLYWKGRSLERLGRNDEAEEVLHQVVLVYGGRYYGIRAAERLGSRLHGGKTSVSATLESWWTRIPGGIVWDRWSSSAEASRDLERVHELTDLGLIEDAAVETRRSRIRLGLQLPPDPTQIRKDGGGGFTFVIRSPHAEDGEYRIPYADHLFSEFKKAGVAGIDPLLLFAMMRQESRFREDIVSPAGAIGLLQIMPATGRRLAADAGWDEYRSEWLYDPFTNIDLSVRYVEKLSKMFEGRWYAVAASYNAGEQVVSEWFRQRKNFLEEEFIEEIPYQETRDYVMKIYANWKAYKVIYGETEGSARASTASR
ncbi:MAG TPA: transglycosylase SLT domain-containing protein [bacterium]|nr:transglycosylase SLT domain-containing protein [bacterium]